MESEADVVIIGGGIVGCSAAYYLAKRGVRTVLVERDQVAGEQSGRNWGFVRQQGRDPAEVPLMVEGNRIWRGLEEEISADIEWVQGGNLALAGDEARMGLFEGWLDIARQHGMDTRILTPAEIDELVPGMAQRWAGGLYTPSDGHAEPVKATDAIRRAAVENGATVHTQCAAEGLDLRAGRIDRVVTEAGEIRAGKVVVAAGAWSSKLLRRVGVNLPQRKVRATVARTTRAPGITTAGVWGPKVAFRQRKDGTLNIAAGGATDFDVTLDALRNMRLFLPNYWKNRKLFKFHWGRPLLRDIAGLAPASPARRRPFSHDRGRETPPNPERAGRALAEMLRLFPALEGLRIQHSWAGYIDTTPDMIPVIEELEKPTGLLIATGFSGHGFAMGPIAGRLIAEMIVDGRASLPIRPFRLSRFKEGDIAPPRNVI